MEKFEPSAPLPVKRFQQAAKRTIDSQADMRWGPDGKGFRRIVHPNGICLKGIWKIDEAPEGTAYTGYFKKGKEGLVIARYSTCCSECRRGRYRSLSLVGKLTRQQTRIIKGFCGRRISSSRRILAAR